MSIRVVLTVAVALNQIAHPEARCVLGGSKPLLRHRQLRDCRLTVVDIEKNRISKVKVEKTPVPTKA